MVARLPTPPNSPPRLVLCADGGGSKVCVVIRSSEGLEVRGTAGPCNVQSVGQNNAAQAILLATYRALSQLPASLLPDFTLPPLPDQKPSAHAAHKSFPPQLSLVSAPTTPFTSRPGSPTPRSPLPPLPTHLFQFAWLALAGISTPFDASAFVPFASVVLCIPPSLIKVTNDVNLLAAPALDIPDIHHVVAVVCGTGTVGRTIRVGHAHHKGRHLPLEDVAVSRGWGYMLCDEGSAFWIGRLAIRALLFLADRQTSSPIYSSEAAPILPFHQDLLSYFGTNDPMDLIELVSLTGRWIGDDRGDPGQVSSRRNAMVAGAARIVLKWAFPDDNIETPPSPVSTSSNTNFSDDPQARSQVEALKIAQNAIVPLIELTMELLGDQTIVVPSQTALALGGGLMMSKGYRGLLLDGVRNKGVEWGRIQCVGDAAGVGALGVANVEFA